MTDVLWRDLFTLVFGVVTAIAGYWSGRKVGIEDVSYWKRVADRQGKLLDKRTEALREVQSARWASGTVHEAVAKVRNLAREGLGPVED